ncbi:MAG: PorP/SprF family type IX secretion system membrane protein, partial [Bacteroidota bacterium]
MTALAAVMMAFGLFWAGAETQAQQDPMFSQYMFNRLVINPAYAGSREQLSAVVIARQQWTGWEGAPRTQSFGIHTPTVDQRHGLGLSVVNDRVGYTDNLLLNFNYAFRIKMGLRSTLALGMNAGMR